jgi:hypothetical protein
MHCPRKVRQERTLRGLGHAVMCGLQALQFEIKALSRLIFELITELAQYDLNEKNF